MSACDICIQTQSKTPSKTFISKEIELCTKNLNETTVYLEHQNQNFKKINLIYIFSGQLMKHNNQYLQSEYFPANLPVLGDPLTSLAIFNHRHRHLELIILRKN